MTVVILIHSSKTMQSGAGAVYATDAVVDVTPRFLAEARELVMQWRQLDVRQMQQAMRLSEKKARDVVEWYLRWSGDVTSGTPAIDAFKGDIYSGLQVSQWSSDDRRYAHNHLLILSGLYGGLRACDRIVPYRLEMGYRLPDGRTLYQFWGARIASLIPRDTHCLMNLSAVEYTKALLPYVDSQIVTPVFLTVHPKTGVPTQVTVHTKIARGAFARWLIQGRIEDEARFHTFAALGYRYDPAQSTPERPVYVCQEFGGKGLSVR